MIPEGARVLLMNHDGRKFIVEASRKMIEVPGLGVVDGTSICDATFGDGMTVGGRRFVLLKPSVRDLLSVIERKAQIMLPKDSFAIPMHLDIAEGSRVIEGGVGSGAMTTVLLKAVGAAGTVYSYEMREDYSALARRNISMAGLSERWELRTEDICRAKLERNVDAAFLDIPNPWDAISNITNSLRPGGHLCCYMPNANQLYQAVTKMREIDLSEIHSFETLQREMVVHDGGIRPSFDMLGHTGYLAFGRKIRF